MTLQTFPAVVHGTCDICGKPFDEGDYIAQPDGDDVMCPDCVIDQQLLEAA